MTHSVFALAIFLRACVVTENRCHWPCCAFLDIHSRMYIVPHWNPDHLVSYDVFLEEFALSENKSPCKSLCCHSHDRRVDNCHGDCWCAEQGRLPSRGIHSSRLMDDAILIYESCYWERYNVSLEDSFYGNRSLWHLDQDWFLITQNLNKSKDPLVES